MSKDRVSSDVMGDITAPLGDTLRQLREQAGYGQRELATLLGWPTNAQLSRYESGDRRPSADVLERILDALDVKDPEREQLLAMVRRDSPGELVTGVPSTGRQLAQLLGYERAASRITDVAPLRFPGLLQTPDYARAVLGDSPDTDKRVTLRIERAEILTRAAHPVQLHALIDSTVLTRPIAPPLVMRKQLRHLLQMAALPTVTVQIIPADAPGRSPHQAGPFILIEFAESTPIVHLEHYRASAFLWQDDDVRSYVAAVDQIAQKAMTPTRTAEVIADTEKSL